MVETSAWTQPVADGVLGLAMTCIVVRCQNGIVVWVRIKVGVHSAQWRCTRDGFLINAPVDPAGVEQFLGALASHSATLAGAIIQVVELTV